MAEKINCTLALTKKSKEMLNMLYMKSTIKTVSEYVRWLIQEECDRQGINIEKEEIHHKSSTGNAALDKINDAVHFLLNKVEIIEEQNKTLLAENNSLKAVNKEQSRILYKLLAGQDTYLNEIQIKADEIYERAEKEYNEKQRKLSIEKANSGKQF